LFFPGAAAAAEKSSAKVAASKLPAETQELMRIIFDQDMFTDQLKEFEIDVKQMPLGKLNKNQIQKVCHVDPEKEEEMENEKEKQREK